MNSFRLKAFFNTLESFGKITKHQKDVYIALLSFFGKDGCYPAHSKIAVEAKTCEKTVRNALKEARLRGWFDWTNERIGRFQTSNRYRITVSPKCINKILNHIRDFKDKDAEIRDFFRRQQIPRSPYYYIKRSQEKLWKTIHKQENELSPFQRLFKSNPELALKQLQIA